MRELDTTITILRPLQGFHFDLISDVFISNELSHSFYYLSYVFPSSVFVDKYELRDRKLNFTLCGETDLEAPTAGSLDKFSLSVRINPSSTRIILPFHARYPIANSTKFDPYASMFVLAPTLYEHSCITEADGSRFVNSTSTIYKIKVPGGTQDHRMLVELGTSLVIWITAVYVYSVIWSVSRGRLFSRMMRG